jgi:hypothetical protein
MVEQIKYEVLETLGRVEIRRYPEIVVARVDGYTDGGFNILFRFISGANVKKTKIDMTAPVISERIAMTAPVLSDDTSIAFVMPEKYTVETIPEPSDGRVKILKVPERLVAALRFSGRWTQSNFNSKTKELLDTLEKELISRKGEVFSMRYDGPFKPWFLRRNEVAVEVEPRTH